MKNIIDIKIKSTPEDTLSSGRARVLVDGLAPITVLFTAETLSGFNFLERIENKLRSLGLLSDGQEVLVSFHTDIPDNIILFGGYKDFSMLLRTKDNIEGQVSGSGTTVSAMERLQAHGYSLH